MLWKFFREFPKPKIQIPKVGLVWACHGGREVCCGFEYLLIILQEEEEKESLAWKVLIEEQTQAMKELTVHELEVWVHRFNFTFVWREPSHLHTSSLIWKANNGSQTECNLEGPAFFHSPLRVTVKPMTTFQINKSVDNNESPAFLCNHSIF